MSSISMKKYILAVCTLFTFTGIQAQYFGLTRCDSITVINQLLSANDTLQLAWSGGLSHVQVSGIDVDLDTKEDLFVFDRVGNRFIVYRNTGTPNAVSYTHYWDQYNAFPTANDWALLLDYNGDGKNDLFHYYNGGVSVYKNTSVAGALSFTLVKSQIYSNYHPNNLVLYISPADIPSITDVDNDGDIDILTYGFSTGCMEWHKNLSQELYGHNDSLVFSLQTDNWGLFTEGLSIYNITLNDSCDTGRVRHAGASILAIDMDNDNDKDLVLGDAGSSNMAYLRNGGSTSFAQMDFFDPAFPQNNTSTLPINLTLFPAAFYTDVNNNGAKDLLVSNSSPGSSETAQSIWRYNNVGTTTAPDFKKLESDFLQNDMIELGEGAFPAMFDYNRDGLMDVAIGNVSYFATQGQVAILKNTGTAGNPVYELISIDMGSVSTQGVKNVTPTFGDMDGDGDVDMIIGETTGYIHYYENTAPVLPNTPAQFALTQTQYFNIKENSFSAPFIIDLNKDGKLDIVCGSRLGKLNYYENTGTTTSPNFSSVATISNLGGVTTVNATFSSSGYSVPCFFDFNGKTELFLGSYSGVIYHYTDIYDGLGQLNTAFTLQSTKVANFKDGLRSAVAVYNFNEDAYIDLIYGNLSGGVDLLYGSFTDVGIEEAQDMGAGMYLYPNPGSTQVYIGSPALWNDMLELCIMDAAGRVIRHLKEFNMVQPVDVTGLSQGLYIFEVRYKGKPVSKLKYIHQ